MNADAQSSEQAAGGNRDDPKPVAVDPQFVELAVEVFVMLAEATRVQIILALRGGELSVNTLAAAVDKPAPAVSQHLAKLRMARIVATRQEGNKVFYRLENAHAAQLVIEAMHQAEHSLGNDHRDHRDHRARQDG